MSADRQRERGLSLAELAIAVAIVASVLAALTPRAVGWWRTGQLRATIATATALKHAVEQYYMVNGAWPTTLAQLAPRYLPTATPTTAWGDPFTLTPGGTTAAITAPIPLGSQPSGLTSPIATLTPTSPTSMTLAVTALIPESAADLVMERNRLTGGTGF